MTSRIFRSTILVAMVVLICSMCMVMGVLYSHFSLVQVNQLKDELSLAVTGTEQYGNAFLENVEADRFRLTWVDTDGTVLFDTQADQTAMENHADREEIREALESGVGSSVRNSATLTQQTLYEAQRLKDGTVLRISTGRASAAALMVELIWPTVAVILVAVVLGVLLARRAAKRIVEPLNRLDLENPLGNTVYEELTPLLRRINAQHIRISEQMTTLRRKADEFRKITDNMGEGLVLLDSEGTVLHINPTAAVLWGDGDGCVGKNFLHLDRSSGLRNALNDALDRGRGVAREPRNGRDYRFELSRIRSDGKVIGAVVLIFDETEQLSAERLRREFSANVSHELKTPLQGIIGSAELLENGLVKEADIPRFVGRIRKEAARLVDLINDIIHLSELDEGGALPMEELELGALVTEICNAFAPMAAEKQLQLTVQAEAVRICGVRRLLYEIVYNLCDNAIKYNKPGGRVTVTLQGRTLTVSDTGIGIPEAHQERIFERFYRVDKSHSKASGGTGLGLSIVKHAVACHKAELKLSSIPGEGTTVTVIF